MCSMDGTCHALQKLKKFLSLRRGAAKRAEDAAPHFGLLYLKCIPGFTFFLEFLDESFIIFYVKISQIKCTKNVTPSQNSVLIFKHLQNFLKIFKRLN